MDNPTGSSANNILDGGTGSDTMTGLAGNDTYAVVDAAHDVVNEAVGGGTDTVLTNLATYTLGANVENLTRPLGPSPSAARSTFWRTSLPAVLACE